MRPGASGSLPGTTLASVGPSSASASPASIPGTSRGVGWVGLFDGPPPRAAGHRRETPCLRWLARALRDSVAERVWAPPVRPPSFGGDGGSQGGASAGGGNGGGVAAEAMSLLLQDLAHAYKGRRAAARRALQSVLSSPPSGRRGRAIPGAEVISRAVRVIAWTPSAAVAGGGEGSDSAESGTGPAGEGKVVVMQTDADEEQCGWLFLCQDLPAWADVSSLCVRVRIYIFNRM